MQAMLDNKGINKVLVRLIDLATNWHFMNVSVN